MNQAATKPLHLDVHEQIECAQTLASRFYTDPPILEIERPRIFLRTWQLVGTLSQSCGEVSGTQRTICDPESYFTTDVAGEPVIVVRDKQGELRAFSNGCRHRAGPIVLGSGCKNVLRFQYHGWTYMLDGRSIGTPDVDGVEFFDRSTMGMVPLRCETTFSDEVQQEDVGLCEQVQHGLRSSTYDRGRYSVKRENGVHYFHMLLNEFLGRP